MENQSKESNALNLGDRGARIEELHSMLKSLNFEVTEPLDCFTEKNKKFSHKVSRTTRVASIWPM